MLKKPHLPPAGATGGRWWLASGGSAPAMARTTGSFEWTDISGSYARQRELAGFCRSKSRAKTVRLQAKVGKLGGHTIVIPGRGSPRQPGISRFPDVQLHI